MRILKEAGLIELKYDSVIIQKHPLHLSSDSPSTHSTDRRRQLGLSLLQKSTTSQQKQFTFSVLYSAAPKTRAKVHEMFLDFISRVKKLSEEDEATEVYQINFDLLHWS